MGESPFASFSGVKKKVQSFAQLCPEHITLCGYRWQAAQQRWHEGRKRLQTVTAKLSDLAVLAVALDEKNLFDAEYLAPRSEAMEESKHRRFVAVLVHLVSLMHAVALATLSGDLSGDNFEVSNPTCCRTADCCCSAVSIVAVPRYPYLREFPPLSLFPVVRLVVGAQ